MSTNSSTYFVSSIARGTDWRDTSKCVLEELEKNRTSGSAFNIGFLYVSDYLADDLTSILNLFKSVLGVEHWVGSVGLGVCGNGTEYIDEPAISAMIGHISPDEFCVFPPLKNDDDVAETVLENWLEKTSPMMVFTHGDPMTDTNPMHLLAKLDDITGAYVVGGMTSSRTHNYQIADQVCENGFSGAIFADSVTVSCTLSQGCKKTGDMHVITNGNDHRIYELGGRPALEVLHEDIRAMTLRKTDAAADQIRVHEAPSTMAAPNNEDMQSMFKGELLAAFPVSDSDQDNYLVRNIISVDEDEHSIDIAHAVAKGERIGFVFRDDATVRNDLSHMLVQLRQRVSREKGSFSAKGGIYISCVARAFTDFTLDEDGQESDKKPERQLGGEMELVRKITGDIPLTGFYAAGEIHCAKQYGYSSILILFV